MTDHNRKLTLPEAAALIADGCRPVEVIYMATGKRP